MKKLLKYLFCAVAVLQLITSCSGKTESKIPKTVVFSPADLKDKIKGGWAGQTIGVSYGALTEFRFKGMMIPDTVDIEWGSVDHIKDWMIKFPGLYDDIYMDLTFVEVFDRLGLDAPVDSFAYSFANAGYNLWEANQTARYNILNGIKPPMSGYWKNNPHANDIDFQIESDFAGLMCPGMPVAAAEICDSIGHIMNYGDGWYGGVYMATMYSLAFVCDDVEFIVTEALKAIPPESRYYQCITDIIDTYHSKPDDWTVAWNRCDEMWDKTIGCPTGAFVDYNIDAALNSAYVVIGLLYGKGDFGKTVDIATRCGQDSDCNPSSAGGILGTMFGYSKIPAKWIDPLKTAENIKFAYTNSSLNDAYQMSYDQALKVIEKNGGWINSDGMIEIKCQTPDVVGLEQCFEGLEPLKGSSYWQTIGPGGFEAKIEGNAFVITGSVDGDANSGYVAEIEVSIDGKVEEIVKMPADFATRKNDIYWNYDLGRKTNSVKLRVLNPSIDNPVSVHTVFEHVIAKKDENL